MLRDVCFDAGLEGTGGRGARPPASSTRVECEAMAGAESDER